MKNNSYVNNRSQQRLVTPPEGGSFRQLTPKKEKEMQTRADKMKIMRREMKDNTTRKH